jgi:hypothetical protein
MEPAKFSGVEADCLAMLGAVINLFLMAASF